MTMRLKFAGTSADKDFTDIFWKPLNLKAQEHVLEDRTLTQQDVREPEHRALELWAHDLQAHDLRAEELSAPELPVAASSTAGRGSRLIEKRLEQDALSEMLEEMSLSTLLYYVLVGEGRDKDESS